MSFLSAPSSRSGFHFLSMFPSLDLFHLFHFSFDSTFDLFPPSNFFIITSLNLLFRFICFIFPFVSSFHFSNCFIISSSHFLILPFCHFRILFNWSNRSRCLKFHPTLRFDFNLILILFFYFLFFV